MAILTITEISKLSFDSNGNIVLSPEMDGTQVEQAIAVGGSSTVCALPFANTTRFIMLDSDVAVCLAFGPQPEAVNGLHRMGAGATRFYGVKSGHKIAAIVST